MYLQLCIAVVFLKGCMDFAPAAGDHTRKSCNFEEDCALHSTGAYFSTYYMAWMAGWIKFYLLLLAIKKS